MPPSLPSTSSSIVRNRVPSNWKNLWSDVIKDFFLRFLSLPLLYTRVSTAVTFWHSAEYGSDFRCNSGEIPRNSAEFAEFRRNCAEITSEVKKIRGIPSRRNSVDTLLYTHCLPCLAFLVNGGMDLPLTSAEASRGCGGFGKIFC